MIITFSPGCEFCNITDSSTMRTFDLSLKYDNSTYKTRTLLHYVCVCVTENHDVCPHKIHTVALMVFKHLCSIQ